MNRSKKPSVDGVHGLWNEIRRPVARGWDGPFFRPLLCGVTVETVLRKPQLMFLDTLVPGGEGVWIYTLSGYAQYRLGNQQQTLRPGTALVVQKPDRGSMVRKRGGLPWHYLWINLGGDEALRRFRLLRDQFGTLQRFAPDSAAVRAAWRLVWAARQETHRPAHAWSRLTFDFLTSWWETIEAGSTPLSEWMREKPHGSRMLPSGPLSVTGFAREMGYNRQYMQRVLKRQWDRPPGEVLRETRLQEAARLLRTSELNVTAIAKQVGFSAQTSLSRAFAKAFKVSPLAYRHSFR